MNMNMIYRMPLADEIDKISRQIAVSYVSAYKGLMSDSYLSSLTEEHWHPILQDSFDRKDTCIIAECDGAIAGSTVFSVCDADGGKFAEWHAFYMLPQFIGCSAGHRFYQRIEEEMVGQGCKLCVLEVLSDNDRAVKFYLSHGFVKAGTFIVEENGMTLSCDRMEKIFQTGE